MKYPKCLSCKYFMCLDGDYCCIDQFKILQGSYGNDNGGWVCNSYMNEILEDNMNKHINCESYELQDKIFDYKEEFDKYRKYIDMQKTYDKFLK